VIVDGAQDGVAVRERLGVTVLGAGQRDPVREEEPALHDAPLERRRLQAVGPQHVGRGERLGEVDGARPVLRARIDRGLDDDGVEPGARQPERRRDPGGAAADDDRVPQFRGDLDSLLFHQAVLSPRLPPKE
jgi:hypothetical protein